MLKETKKILKIHQENMRSAKKDLKNKEITKYQYMELIIEFHRFVSVMLKDNLENNQEGF